MFKRLRWMLIGVLLAGAGYVWLSGRARTMAPGAERAAREAGRAVSDLGLRLREAVRDGREEMSRREGELRRDLLGEPTPARG